MSIIISLFFILFITIVQCQNLKDNPTNTNIETCSCDLYNGTCDTSCCCDPDCSIEDLKAFDCHSKANEDTATTSSTPVIQSTCFKDLSIYKSNSPYVIQKKGDLVCVDYEQNIDTNSIDYEKVINQQIDSSILSRSINIDSSVSSPVGTATNLTVYEAGTSVFKYFLADNTTSYYNLPVKLFNSAVCLGYQPITYLNDFTSICSQPVNSETCTGVLNPTRYITNLNLIKLPATLAIGNVSYTICNGSGSTSSLNSTTCIGALQNFDLTIYYSGSSGITGCNITNISTLNPTLNSTIQQTFTVRFVQIGPTTTGTSRSGNPGYLPGASIIAGNSNGSSINEISNFTVLQASISGYCSSTNRKSISFGENVQSICLLSLTNNSCPSIPNLEEIFTPYNLTNLYVAAYGNPDPSNITGYWLPVQFCVSQVGSSSGPTCGTSSVLPTPSGQCYTRLDIQIAFANVGSVTNAQPILGAVVFYYQRVAITSATQLVMTQTVTFTDISNLPPTGGNLLPQPNTRIPGDFFYPFTLNQATHSVTFSLVFNLFVGFLFLFM